MASIDSVTNARTQLIDSLNGNKATESASELAAEDVAKRFLTLLTAQLENQDPLNPMDNAQMTSQLAQLSTVEGINTMNANMQKLLDQLGGGGLTQAVAFIGKDVVVEGDQLVLSDNGALGAVDLSAAANSVTLQITNEAGEVVRNLDLGALGSGYHEFAWDGLNNQGEVLTNGVYTFKATAMQSDGSANVTQFVAARVNAVSLNAGTASLDLQGLGSRSIADIKSIRESI